MLWHPANPDAVDVLRRARPRERARRARADLERDVGAPQPAAPARLAHAAGRACSPRRTQFFVRIREASHAFQGVMKATLPRGEAYEFLELGAHLERADTTTRLLAVKVPGLRGAAEPRRGHERRALGAAALVRRLRGLPQAGQRRAARPRGRRVPAARAQRCRAPSASASSSRLRSIRAISGDALRPERAIGRRLRRARRSPTCTRSTRSTEQLLERVRARPRRRRPRRSPRATSRRA